MAGWLPRLFTAVLPKTRPFQPMGVSGTPVYAGYALTAEKSPKLIGQEKYRTYSEMLANVSIIAAGVRYFLNIISKPSWSAEAPEDSGGEGDKYVDFVNDALFEDMHTPWSRVIRRMGTYRFHGFNIQEWTAKRRDDNKIGFHDIESRPQWTIWRWEVDERGKVTGAWQRDPLTGRELGLPRGKLIYLVDDTITDSPEGMGLLRHCYEPARRLEEFQKQEGFGYLRDLQGVPLGRAPITELQSLVNTGKMTQAQMNNALQTLENFVTLEKKDRKTGIVLDSQPFVDVSESGLSVAGQMKWGLELIGGAAPGLPAINQAIVRLNTEIARILGVEHLLLGADAEGSFALAKEKARDMYLLANSVLRDIREQVQHDLLWPLWKLNGFPDEMMPEMKTEDVSPKDVQQITAAMRDLATSGAPLQPDDEIQNSIRDLLGMPHIDLDKIADMMQQQQALQVQSQQQQQGPDGQPQPNPESEASQPGADEVAAMQARQETKKRLSDVIRKAKGAQVTNGANEALRPIITRASYLLYKMDHMDKTWTQQAREAALEARRAHMKGELAPTLQAHSKNKQTVSSFLHDSMKYVTNFISHHKTEIGMLAIAGVSEGVGLAVYTAAEPLLVSALASKVTGRISADVLSGSAGALVYALGEKLKANFHDAKNFASGAIKSILQGSGEKVEKADDPDSGDKEIMIEVLKQLLECIDNLQENAVAKMVAYNQARPYRWEDDTFGSRAGASDGSMDAHTEDYFSSLGGVQGRSQGPYGSMKGPDNQRTPLNLGDDMRPGSRLKAKGRRRTIP